MLRILKSQNLKLAKNSSLPKMEIYKLVLDWPPSVNHTWVRYGKRIVLAKDAQIFRLAVVSRVAAARAKGLLPAQPFLGHIGVKLILHPVDNRKRDIDNYCKSVFDALTKANLWQDDSQIKELIALFGEKNKPGSVELFIKPLGNLLLTT